MRAGLVILVTGCSAATATAPPKTSATLTVRLPATQLDRPTQHAHLLNRFAFGPSVDDVSRLSAEGMEAWLAEQLQPGTDPAMVERLSGFKTLQLPVGEAAREYPTPAQVLKKEGLEPKTAEAARLRAMMNPESLPRQLVVELTQAKLLRAAHSRRQVEEVLVDFWFNHFNVTAEKGPTRWMVNAYERDAIRPHVFGRFRDMLGATAKHPAMLFYLDNWRSTREGFERRKARGDDDGDDAPLGLNENYARELLELHTVGVNAGYTQEDVREAARVLTGWTFERRPQKPRFGQFIFGPLAHDDAEHRVFGLSIPAGGGQAQGEALLDFLARHPSTARRVALELCQRFVSDAPPPALVDRVAAVFLARDGDLRATVQAIVESPEFWDPAVVNAKIRTPFEFVVASVRAVGTLDEVQRPMATALEKLGQPPYRCAPPTGYREDSAAWISAGALVTRIDFGLKLASGRIGGVVLRQPERRSGVRPIAEQLLGRPVSDRTLSTLQRALGSEGDELDEARPLDVSKVVGLVLGSPEFQRQ